MTPTLFPSSLSHGRLWPVTQSLSSDPILGPFPSSFSRHWGTGSEMGEALAQAWRQTRLESPGGSGGGGVGYGSTSQCREGLERDVHLSQPCFLPHHHWQSWITFSKKNTCRTQMFRLFQNKKNQSQWSCPSVFSITYEWCSKKI